MKFELSIIFVYYNTPKEILNAIRSIKDTVKKIRYQIVIVDNNSKIPLPKQILNVKNVKVIKNKKNEGYGKGINIGVKNSNGKFILLVNPDIVFLKDSINLMLKKMEKSPNIGILSPLYMDVHGKRLKNISSFPLLPRAIFAFSILHDIFPGNIFSKQYWLTDTDVSKEQSVDVVGGACMIMKRSVFNDLKGFDESFFLYFEESDLCLRTKKLGYNVVYYPQSKIIHFVGRSLADKDKIEKYFESSRLRFFKKYHNFLFAYTGEMIIRILKPRSIFIILILSLSAFLNFYRINDLMLFIGDAARDYLAARDMILTGVIPLVGIPSSVVWLHQGPLSVYLIGIAFLYSNFNPVAPAILYATLGILGTYLVYKVGAIYFDSNIGLISALFYTTSPLVIINARMPYHTSSIPVIASLFFILLYKVMSGEKKLLFLTFFVYGLLLQVELSNSVLLVIIFFLYFINRKNILFRDIFYSISGFLLGILPFILYDLRNNFVYSIGFPLWVLNRIRLFLGIAADKKATISHLPTGIETIIQQISAIIFPASLIIFLIIILFVGYQLFNYRKDFIEKGILQNKKNIILLWIVIPLLAYSIHTTPGSAYFPLLFPAISVLIGFIFYKMILRSKFYLLAFVFVCSVNVFILLKNDYFIATNQRSNLLPPFSYNLGSSWTVSDNIARSIVSDSKKMPFVIKGGGFFSTIPTGADTYKYLAWWRKGKIENDAKLTYIVFDKTEKHPELAKVFEDKYSVVLKYEAK